MKRRFEFAKPFHGYTKEPFKGWKIRGHLTSGQYRGITGTHDALGAAKCGRKDFLWPGTMYGRHR
jgi:hypothetical protein